MALQLTMFETAREAAEALAQQVSEDLQKALAARQQAGSGRALLLVSGGKSPLPFFYALSQQPLPWEQIDVSLVDERSVPFGHPDSNASLISEHLLRGAAKAATLHPLMQPGGEAGDPWQWAQQSAAAANANIRLAQPAAIVLGLGTDGHTASLFPDAVQWQNAYTTEQRYLAVQPGQAPHPRVSLSLQALIDQQRCYVWSNGAAKLDVIKQAKSLFAAVSDGLLDGRAIHAAGPFALLVAHPDLMLHVFHHDE